MSPLDRDSGQWLFSSLRDPGWYPWVRVVGYDWGRLKVLVRVPSRPPA